MLVRFALVLAGNDVSIVGNHQNTLLESDAVVGEHLVDDLIASQDPLLSYITAVRYDAHLFSGFCK